MLIIWTVLFLHVVRAEPTYPDEADDPNDPGFPADPNDPTSPPYPPKEDDPPKKYSSYGRFDVPNYPDGLNNLKSDDDLKSDEDLNSDDDLNHQVIAPYPPKSRSSYANEYDQSNSDETNRYNAVQTRRNKNYRVVVKQKLRIRKPKTVNVSRIVTTKVRRTRPVVHKVIRHYKTVRRPQKSKVHGFNKGGKDWKSKGGKLINLTLVDTDSDSSSDSTEESPKMSKHSDSDETNETGESLERRFTNVYTKKSKIKYMPTYNKIELSKKGNKVTLNQENVDIAPVYQDSLNYDKSNNFKGKYPKNRQYYSKYQESYVHNNVGTVPKDKTLLVLEKFPSDNYQFSSSEEDSDDIGLSNGSPLQSQYRMNTNMPISYEEKIRTSYPKYSSGLEYLPKFTTYKETLREHRHPDYVITQLLHRISPQLNANEDKLVEQAPYKENLRVNDIAKQTIQKYDLKNDLNIQDVKNLQDDEEASNSSEDQESVETQHLWDLNSTVKNYPAEVNEFGKMLEKVQQFLGQYKNNGGELLTEARANTDLDEDSPKKLNSENSNQFQYLSSLRGLSSNHESNLDGAVTSAKFYLEGQARQNNDDNKNPPLRTSPFHDKYEADDMPLYGRDNFSEVLVTKETNSLKQLPLDDNENALNQKLYIDTPGNTPIHELSVGDLRQNDYNYTSNSISPRELPEEHSDDVADQIIYIDTPKITARDELSVVNTGENDSNNTKKTISLREIPLKYSNEVADQIIDASENTDIYNNDRENDNYYTTDVNDMIKSVSRDEYGVLGIDNTESRAKGEGDNSNARQNEVNYTADLKTFRTLPVNHSDDVADQIYIEDNVSVIPLNPNDLRQEASRAAESYPANEVEKLPQLKSEQDSEELISDLIEEALVPIVTNEAETYKEEVEDVTSPLEHDHITEQPDLFSQQLSNDTPEIFTNEANLRQTYRQEQDYTTKGPVTNSLQQDYTTKGPVPMLYSLQQDYTTKGPVPYSLQQDYTTKGPVPYSLQQDYTTKGPVPMLYSLQQDYTTKQPVPLSVALDDKVNLKETQMRQSFVPMDSNEVIAKKVPAGRSQYIPDYSSEDGEVDSEVTAKKDTRLTLALDTNADSSSSDTREGTGNLRNGKKLRSYLPPNWTNYFDDDVYDSASVENSDAGETAEETNVDTAETTQESDQQSGEMAGPNVVPFVLALAHAQSLGGLNRFPDYEDHTTTIGRLCKLAKNNLLRLRALVATAYGLNTDTADEKDLITIVYILGKLNEARATKRPVEKLVDDFLVNLQRLAVLRKLLCKNFDNEHTYDEITDEVVTNESNYVDMLREYLEKTGQNITSYYERYYPNNGKATGKSKDSVRFGQDRWQVNPIDKELEHTDFLSKTTAKPTKVPSLDMLNQLLNKYKTTTRPPPTTGPPFVHTTPPVAHVVTEIPSYLDTTVTLPNSPTNYDYDHQQQIGHTDSFYDNGVLTEESLVEHTTQVPIEIWLPTLPTNVDQNDNNSPVQYTDDFINHQSGQYPDNQNIHEPDLHHDHQHHVDQNEQLDNTHTKPSEDYYPPTTELNPTPLDHSAEYDELIEEFKQFMEQHPPKPQEVTRPGYSEWELNPGKKFKHFDISLDGKKMIFKVGGKDNEHHHRISIEGILHKVDIENIMKVAHFESVDQTPVDEELRTLFEQRDKANEAIFTEYLWLNVQKLRAAQVDEHKINNYVHFITTKVYPALFRALKGCQDLKVKIAKSKLKLYMPKV